MSEEIRRGFAAGWLMLPDRAHEGAPVVTGTQGQVVRYNPERASYAAEVAALLDRVGRAPGR